MRLSVPEEFHLINYKKVNSKVFSQLYTIFKRNKANTLQDLATSS